MRTIKGVLDEAAAEGFIDADTHMALRLELDSLTASAAPASDSAVFDALEKLAKGFTRPTDRQFMRHVISTTRALLNEATETVMLTDEQRKALSIAATNGYLSARERASIRELLAASAAPAEGREPADTYKGSNPEIIAQALYCNEHGDTESCENWLHLLRDRLATAPTMSEAARDVLWRHKKTGGVYSFVAESRMERDPKAVVVTYRNIKTGETWTRPYGEFHDGRFERIDRAAAKGESK